jgi:predicted enzyme related to lactoylglutathione lyase
MNSGCQREGTADVSSANLEITEGSPQVRANITLGESMKIQYVEIVTPDVDAVCAVYVELHGVSFSDPDQNVGGARTAGLEDGVTLGVRSPMHAGEKPVVRPYILVEDIDAAVEKAEKAGAQTIVPPMPIPGKGKCAIVYQGGIELGLWQL